MCHVCPGALRNNSQANSAEYCQWDKTEVCGSLWWWGRGSRSYIAKVTVPFVSSGCRPRLIKIIIIFVSMIRKYCLMVVAPAAFASDIGHHSSRACIVYITAVENTACFSVPCVILFQIRLYCQYSWDGIKYLPSVYHIIHKINYRWCRSMAPNYRAAAHYRAA